MPRCRTLARSRLTPETVEEYVRLHQQVPPELLDAYRAAGITRISCFLDGLDLVVTYEYESETYEQRKEALKNAPAELRWQALMKSLRDPAIEAREYKEIFYMPPEESVP